MLSKKKNKKQNKRSKVESHPPKRETFKQELSSGAAGLAIANRDHSRYE